MKKINLIGLGAGGHTKVLIDIINKDKNYNILGLIDTKDSKSEDLKNIDCIVRLLIFFGSSLYLLEPIFTVVLSFLSRYGTIYIFHINVALYQNNL